MQFRISATDDAVTDYPCSCCRLSLRGGHHVLENCIASKHVMKDVVVVDWLAIFYIRTVHTV